MGFILACFGHRLSIKVEHDKRNLLRLLVLIFALRLLSDVSAEFPSNVGGDCSAFVLHPAAGPNSGYYAAHRHVRLGR